MSEDGTGALTAPASVTIPSGSSTATGSLTYNANGPSIGTVKITAATNGASPASATISVLPVPAPSGLTAAAGNHSASLRWNSLAYNVTDYRIYRSSLTTPAWTQIASVSATPTPSYVDTSALNGEEYYYQVAGYSTKTDEGLRSTSATATLPQQLKSLALSLPSSAIVGQSFPATVTATDDNGKPYTRGLTATLTAPGPGTLTPTPTPVVIPAEAARARPQPATMPWAP